MKLDYENMLEISLPKKTYWMYLRTVISNRTYYLEIQWNTRDEGWWINILDENEEILLAGKRLNINVPVFMSKTDKNLPEVILIPLRIDLSPVAIGKDDLGSKVFLYAVPRISEI